MKKISNKPPVNLAEGGGFMSSLKFNMLKRFAIFLSVLMIVGVYSLMRWLKSH